MFVLATFALAVMTVFQGGAALTLNCTSIATVNTGDTCSTISANNNITLCALLALNPLVNSGCTNLYPGETLCLGVGSGQTTCSPTYVVQSGDTCSAIANQFNITLATLYANNPSINQGCTNLFIGQVLCVSSTIY